MQTNITIVGFGNMGKAIKKALLSSDAKLKIVDVDLNQKKIENVKKSDFIFISVKPQDAVNVIKEIKKQELQEKTILISIMAGFPIEKIKQISGHKKIVRMMPNMGLLVGAGISAWKAVGLSKKENKKVKNFLNKICENFEVKNEDMINKVTAISGSGPAYFLLLADYLNKEARALGFTKEESRKLVEQTFSSAALLQKGNEYEELIKKITSKGGTTEKAIKVFQKEKLNKIVKNAVMGAYKRAQELSR